MKSPTEIAAAIQSVAEGASTDKSPAQRASTRRIRLAALLFIGAAGASVAWIYQKLEVVKPTRIIRIGGFNSNAVLEVSPKGDELLTTVFDGWPNYPSAVVAWKTPEFSAPRHLRGHSSLLSARYSPCGRYVAIGGDSGIRVMERSTKKEKFRFVVMRPFSDSLSFSRDGRFLAATGGATEIPIWDLSDGSGPMIAPAHDIEHATFIGKGDELLVVNRKHPAASVWSAGESRWLADIPLELRSNEIDDVGLSSAGERFVIVERDGSVRMWNAESRTKLIEFVAQHGSKVSSRSICFSPDNRFLVTAAFETHNQPRVIFQMPYFDWTQHRFTSFMVWDAATGRLLRQWTDENIHHQLRPIAGTTEFASIATPHNAFETRLNFWALPDR